jgi:DNA invertase Pin-like site-specific DNA recombinase/uncharacterized small protein (DUF1192 family)
MIPVASLARVSSAGQARDDREGLPRQRIAIAEAVHRHGLHVVEAFELPGVSGSLVGDTPEWARIMDLFRDGTIRGIACDAVDRITRAQGYDLTVISDLHKVGATIYTPTNTSDMTNPNEGLMASILSLFGGREADEIARRFRGAKKTKRKKGGWTQGNHKLPMGITYNRTVKPHRWEYTPDIEVIVDLHERYASGVGSIRSIAASLGLSNDRARSYLSHPLYRGRMPDLDGGLIAIDIEPAISPDLAARVDARRSKRARVYTGARRRKLAAGLGLDAPDPDLHALRDVAHCARCGQRCDTGINRKRKADGSGWYEWRFYRCRSANRRIKIGEEQTICDAPGIPIEDAHRVVSKAMVFTFGDPDLWARAVDEVSGGSKASRAEVDRLTAHRDKLTAKRKRAASLFIDGMIERVDFDKRAREIDRQLESIEVEIAGLEADAVDGEAAMETINALGREVWELIFESKTDGVPALLRAVGGRAYLDRVRGTGPAAMMEMMAIHPPGHWISVERRGRSTFLVRADLDATTVSRGLVDAARGLDSMRTKSGSSSRQSARFGATRVGRVPLPLGR